MTKRISICSGIEKLEISNFGYENQADLEQMKRSLFGVTIGELVFTNSTEMSQRSMYVQILI